jgi:hypothetical protein
MTLRRRVARKASAPPAQAELRLSPPKRLRPDDLVRRHFASCSPEGVPASYREITHSEYRGAGKRRTAVASLVMVDGLQATVEVFGWGDGCVGHRWLEWEGADLAFEDGRWQRVDLSGDQDGAPA